MPARRASIKSPPPDWSSRLNSLEIACWRKPSPKKNTKTDGALSQIKIAEAASQEIQDCGDPRALCNEWIRAGGHFAGGKVGIEESKYVKEEGNAKQDCPPEDCETACGACKPGR
jgi:hypothetical protein